MVIDRYTGDCQRGKDEGVVGRAKLCLSFVSVLVDDTPEYCAYALQFKRHFAVGPVNQ
jgi:hypothetical protein